MAEFAYLCDSSGGTIRGYSINLSTGNLTGVGSAQSIGSTPISIAVLNASFVYVSASAGIYAFPINLDGGLGALIAGSPFLSIATPYAPYDLAMDPFGRFLFANSYTYTFITSLVVNQTTGALTVANTVSNPQNNRYGVAATNDGKYLYTANQAGSNNLYSINQANGVLTLVGTIPLTNSNGVKIHPTKNFLYSYVGSSGLIYSFAINSDGSLTPVNNSTSGYANGQITIHPSGKYIFISNNLGISAFNINQSTGSIAFSYNTPTSAGNALALSIEPSGQFAYNVGSSPNNTYVYPINPSTGGMGSSTVVSVPWFYPSAYKGWFGFTNTILPTPRFVVTSPSRRQILKVLDKGN